MKKYSFLIFFALLVTISTNAIYASVGPGASLSPSTTPGGASNVLSSENVDYNEKQVFTTKVGGIIISIPRYVQCSQGHLTINDVVFNDWSDNLEVQPLAQVSFMVRGLKVESKFDIIAKDALGNVVDKAVKIIGVEMDMNSKGKMVTKASYDPFGYTIERDKGIATVEVVTHTEG